MLYGADRASSLMRKFGIKYAANHPRYLEVREAFTKTRSRADWQAVLDTWYSEDLPGVYPSAEVHRVQGSSCADYAETCGDSAS